MTRQKHWRRPPLVVVDSADVKPLLACACSTPAVSEADSVVKVAEWQQTYYSSDSGIQSGATTVRDDESSTEYSGRKKYTSSSSAVSNSAASAGGAAGGGDPVLESPTGETLRLDEQDVVSSPSSSLLSSSACFTLIKQSFVRNTESTIFVDKMKRIKD